MQTGPGDALHFGFGFGFDLICFRFSFPLSFREHVSSAGWEASTFDEGSSFSGGGGLPLAGLSQAYRTVDGRLAPLFGELQLFLEGPPLRPKPRGCNLDVSLPQPVSRRVKRGFLLRTQPGDGDSAEETILSSPAHG